MSGSSATTPTLSDYLNASYWAYAQAGTDYVDGDTTLPTGLSYFMLNGAPAIAYDPGTGFYGAALVTGTGQVIVVFEGTNVFTGNCTFTAAQTVDDAAITAGTDALSYQTALNFTQTVIDAIGKDGDAATKVYLAGHSLGAADAEYVAAQTGLSGTTFGTPGIPAADTTLNPDGLLTDYVEEGDPVGNYAEGGNEDIILQADNIIHYGTADYIGSYVGLAVLYSADAAYLTYLSATTVAAQAAALATTVSILAGAAATYHPLGTYAATLGVTIDNGGTGADGLGSALPGSMLNTSTTGQLPGLTFDANGAVDVPGFDVAAATSVVTANGSTTFTIAGQDYAIPLPSGSGAGFSVSSDGNGGATVSQGVGSSGFVFAGGEGATVQGGAAPLYFVGGAGAVSVSAGSGNATILGSTGKANSIEYGGSGADTLSAGMGASTLVGGSGTSTMFANGSGDLEMVAGSGYSIVAGQGGSGAETMFTNPFGQGVSLIALNNAADTVVGGSGASTVVGGSGSDIFGFIDGHAGGSEVILNFSAHDNLAFGGYGSGVIVAEQVENGGDNILLSDHTEIRLVGIDHKIFS